MRCLPAASCSTRCSSAACPRRCSRCSPSTASRPAAPGRRWRRASRPRRDVSSRCNLHPCRPVDRKPTMFDRDSITAAQRTVRAVFAPTPQQVWPLLNRRVGAEVWVKHENHTPVGAFKLRGGLTYFEALRRREPDCRGVVSAAREHTGAKSRIVGVVSAQAPAYLESFRAGRIVEAPVSTLLADGMACRLPDAQALEIIRREVDDVVAVTDTEVAAAMRALFADTHNVAEGAGAASLAAALQQRERWAGRCVGVTISGGNVDSQIFAQVLAG